MIPISNISNNNNSNINMANQTFLTNSKSLYQLQTSSSLFSPLPIKPKFFKLFNDVIVNCNQSIFNYLTLQEVSLLRSVNKLFLNLINDYYEIRLKLEINEITNFQNQNEENTMLYMQNIDSQIPISNENWLEFDLKKVTKNMELLDKNTIIQLKSIKKLNKFNETIYAPFCIIFGYKSSNYKVKLNGWKKTADSILNEPNISQKIKQLDYENFSDDDILKAFLYLNSEELSLSRIKRYSMPFARLIKWCQSVVSYHILIHPYTFRNKTSQIEKGSDVHKYVLFMDTIICKFYRFKRFLFKLGLVQIPLGDYVFNLQHNKIISKEKTDLSKIITVDMIANILSYLSLEQSYKFINVNQFGVNCFKQSLNINCYKIIKEIILFKLETYDKLYQVFPVLYENNIFGKYFLMLDDILNSTVDANQFGTNYAPFLTKEHLNEIRNLKSENQYINNICKIFCLLFNIKVEKKANKRGEIVPLYIKAVKLLAIKGILPKSMRYFNKLELNKKQLQVLMNEIINLYGKNIIQEIKKINKGIYQILIWELLLFEYLKEFNPFMFINLELFEKNLENNYSEDIQLLNYYLELINYLKYNLKFKYHFQSLVFTNMPEVPCYEFIPIVTNLLQEINTEKKNISHLLDNSNNDKTKTANIYFENKDYLPINAMPALYERITEEIYNINEKLYINTVSNENLLYKNYYNNFNNKINTNNINENISESNNLGMIREENIPVANIGDNQIINKYLKNINNNIIQNINNNIISNINGINDLENGGVQHLTDNNQNIIDNNQIMNNFDIISSINYQNRNKNILQTNTNFCTINDIPDNIILKNILLYLDIKSVLPFSTVNKKCNKCYKINMFLRLLILDSHKQIFENENTEFIQSIDAKRNTFFTDYEIPPPNKDHALELISQLSNKDIIEIKNIYRKYNKYNEILIAPFVYLLGGKPKKNYNVNGQKRMNYFNTAQKMLNDRKINKKIKNINLETITSNTFREIEKLLKNDAFSFKKMKGYSPCLNHLIYWELGVLEYHRAVRYFCLNYYDYKILSKEEIVFCGQMDNINIMFNKLKYYSYKFCKNYEKDAINIMKELNSALGIINNENENENNEEEEENDYENEEEIEEDNDYNMNNKKEQIKEEQIVFENNNINVNSSNDVNNVNINENIKDENNNEIYDIEKNVIENENNVKNNELNQLEDSIDFKNEINIENNKNIQIEENNHKINENKENNKDNNIKNEDVQEYKEESNINNNNKEEIINENNIKKEESNNKIINEEEQNITEKNIKNKEESINDILIENYEHNEEMMISNDENLNDNENNKLNENQNQNKDKNIINENFISNEFDNENLENNNENIINKENDNDYISNNSNNNEIDNNNNNLNKVSINDINDNNQNADNENNLNNINKENLDNINEDNVKENINEKNINEE